MTHRSRSAPFFCPAFTFHLTPKRRTRATPTMFGMNPNLSPSETHLSARQMLVVATTSVGFVVSQLDVSIVNVALTSIGHDLDAGVASLQWTVDSYALTFASLMLSAGTLG